MELLFFVSNRYHHLAIIIAVLLTVLALQAQSPEATDEPLFPPDTPTQLPSATPTPTSTPTATVTPTPTLTLTPLQPVSATITVPISATMTSIPTLTPISEATEELIPVSGTAPVTPTVTSISGTQTPVAISSTLTAVSTTITATPSAISGTLTPTLTAISGTPISGTITPTVMPTISATVISTPITPTIQPTATIGAIPLQYVQGIARYQNNALGNSGIQLQIIADDDTLISDVLTNEDGIYSVAVPLEGAYQMVFSARAHRTERLTLTAVDPISEVTLSAGDLNSDGCINLADFALMQAQLTLDDEVVDLNGDGLMDIADTAMLAGNLDAYCNNITPTATPMPILTPVSTTVQVVPVTLTPMTAISPTDPEVTAEPVDNTIAPEVTSEPASQ